MKEKGEVEGIEEEEETVCGTVAVNSKAVQIETII